MQSKEDTCRLYDKHTDAHHHGVKYTQVALHAHFTFLIDFNESHEHIRSWDSNIIKLAPAIIFGVVADLGAEVAAFDTFTDLPSGNISDLNHEGLHTIVLLIDNQSGEDDGMTCEATEITRPVLGSTDVRRINDELISGLV